MSTPILILLLLEAAVATRSGPWPPRGYACPRTTVAVHIDGRLDDAAWSLAPWTDDFVDIEGSRRPSPRFRTRAKMLWDDEYFYVAASLEEPHLWATLRERDSIIFHDNDFEVFLDPDFDSHLYTEIEINALGTVWDLLLVKPYRDGGPAIHAWDIPGLRSAVHLDGSLNDPSDEDGGWSVEIAIPFVALDETTKASCPPQAGDRWRVNFSRVQWKLDRSAEGYTKTVDPESGKSLPEDNWVWSPQREIAMHEPEHWGIVEFRERDEGTLVVIPDARDAAAWVLRRASYDLAQRSESEGRYPDHYDWPAAKPGEVPQGEEWLWPPQYRSDGRRYTLRYESPEGTLLLDENGQLSWQTRD